MSTLSDMSDADKLAFADRFAAASRSNDAEAYAALCSPDSVTWHNFDDAEMSTQQTSRTVAWLHRTVPDLSWVDIATSPTPTGFVSQTVMTGTAPGGPMRVHSCVVVTLDDGGLVLRVEEYLDPNQTSVLSG